MAVNRINSWINVNIFTSGGNKVNQTVFDYFSNTPSVNDVLEFSMGDTFFKDIKFYVGTPMDGSPIFVWEYFNGTAWTTLQVHNGNALTKSGEQIVTFTMPKDEDCQAPSSQVYNWWFNMRVRLTDVTGVTEGGAQSTQAVTVNDLGVIVTGTETIPSINTADLAGSYEICPATTCAVGIVTAKPTTTLYENCAERITIVLTGTSAGAGDTVDINGLTEDGTAFSETIDVSAGDGTYVSALDYHDVASVDCNGFTDGTITVSSNRWGVIYKPSVDTYLFGGHLIIGDGSTTTTLTGSYNHVNFPRGYKYLAKNHATWVMENSTINSSYAANDSHFWTKDDSYGATFTFTNVQINITPTKTWVYALYALSGLDTFNFTNVTVSSLTNSANFYITAGVFNLTNVRFNGGTNFYFWNFQGAGFNIEDVSCDMGTTILASGNVYFNGFNVPSVNLFLLYGYVPGGAHYYFDNCIIPTFTWGWGAQSGDASQRCGFTLNVVDGNGDGIEGATVAYYDVDGVNVYSGTTDASGVIAQQMMTYAFNAPNTTSFVATTPHKIKILDYLKQYYSYNKSFSVVSTDVIPLVDDAFVTAAFATADAYTGITIDWSGNSITLTEAHTIEEVYDYCKAKNIANIAYNQPVTTIDGVNFVSTFDITVDGVALTGTGKKLNLGTGTFTLTGGGSTDMTVTDVTGTNVPITVNTIVSGSRLQIYDVTEDAELYNDIVTGTSVSVSFLHTGTDHDLRIRLIYVDGATTAYYWWTATGAVTNAGFSINATQVENTVYEIANVDGSTVSECTVTGAIPSIAIDDPDNATTAQRIYNFYQYYLFTEAGIAEQDNYITATDSTHYIFDNTMKIVNSDTVHPLSITGANITPVSGAATNVFDLTNGASISINFNRVEGFSYSSGSGLSPEEHNALINNLDSQVSKIPTTIPELIVDGELVV